MHLPPQSPAVAPQPSFEAQPERIEILEAFADLPDVRQASGKRHHMALCLALKDVQPSNTSSPGQG
jgi:hypothetical protein